MADLVIDQHEQGDVYANAAFSVDRVYRYALTRCWGSQPAVAFVMLNPSTADAMQDDATIRRCTGYARRWGAGGILVVNLFALRATDPARLFEHADPVGPDNDAEIARRLDLCRIGPVVAAWGAHPKAAERVGRILEILDGRELTCLGLTRDGAPRHPLYLRNDAAPMAWAPIGVTV